jgi:hypothetical protein
VRLKYVLIVIARSKAWDLSIQRQGSCVQMLLETLMCADIILLCVVLSCWGRSRATDPHFSSYKVYTKAPIQGGLPNVEKGSNPN